MILKRNLWWQILTFIVAGFFAAAISLFAEYFIQTTLYSPAHIAQYSVLGIFTNAIIEMGLILIGTHLLLKWFEKEHSLGDVLTYVILIAFVYAMVENLGYFASGNTNGIAQSLAMRFAGAVPARLLAAVALGLYWPHGIVKRKVWRVVKQIFIATFVLTLFNYFTLFGNFAEAEVVLVIIAILLYFKFRKVSLRWRTKSL